MVALSRTILGLTLLLAFFAPLHPVHAEPPSPRAKNPDHVAPWEEVTFTPRGVEVLVGGRRYQLVSLEGIATRYLVATSKKLCKANWKSGLRQKIVPILRYLGKRPRKWISMQGVHLPSKKLTRLRGVALTRFNYDAVLRAGRRAAVSKANSTRKRNKTRTQPAAPGVSKPAAPKPMPPTPRTENKPADPQAAGETSATKTESPSAADPKPTTKDDLPVTAQNQEVPPANKPESPAAAPTESAPDEFTPSEATADESKAGKADLPTEDRQPGLVAETPPNLSPEAGPTPETDGAEGSRPRAPWDAIHFPEGTRDIHVKLGESWARLVKFNTVKALHLVMAAQQQFAADWKNQLATNLDGVLAKMNRRPNDSVRLELIPFDAASTNRADTRTVSMSAERGARTAASWRRQGNRPATREAARDDASRRAPWDAVLWDTDDDGSDRMRVRISDSWFHVDRIDGVRMADVIAEAKSRHGSTWQPQVEERLDALLKHLGTTLGSSVTVDVRAFSSGSPYSLDVPHTAANVERLIEARARAPIDTTPPPPTATTETSKPPAPTAANKPSASAKTPTRGATEATPPATPTSPSLDDVLSGTHTKKGDLLSKEEAQRDIEALKSLLDERYVGLREHVSGCKGALDGIVDRIPATGVSRRTFVEDVHRALAVGLSDGVSRVVDIDRVLSASGDVDVEFVRVGQRVVGLVGADETPLGPTSTPLVGAIDGISIETWLAAASEFAPGATDHGRAHATASYLRHVGALRPRVGAGTSHPSVSIALQSPAGQDRSEVKLPLRTGAALRFGAGAVRGTRLAGNVGHIKIAAMTSLERDLADLNDWLTRLGNAKGLILDVRNTSGNALAMVEQVLSRVVDGKETWIPIAALATRKIGKEPTAVSRQLEAAGFVSTASKKLTRSDRKTLDNLVSRAQVAISSDPEALASRYAYVMSLGSTGSPKRINRQLVVLTNAGTRGAAEALVSLLAGRPRITILGTPTAGRFALTTRHRLPVSGIKVDLSVTSMVDGKGVPFVGVAREPDVTVPATWEDATDEAKDAQLTAAREHLLK